MTMLSRLERGWRIIATGCCFAIISFGGFLLACTWFPLLRLLTRDRGRLTRRVRRSIALWFRNMLRFARITGVLRIEVHGRERLQAFQGLVIANHPTLLDVVVLMGCKPEMDCVVKQALRNHFFMRGVVQSADYIPNQAEPALLLQNCTDRLKSGGSLLIFPEGTRTRPEGGTRLLRGAASVAAMANCRVLPVVITCDPPTLAKGTPWYGVPSRRFTLRLNVGTPIEVAEIAPDDLVRSVRARRLTDHFNDYFREQLDHGGTGDRDPGADCRSAGTGGHRAW